MTSAAVTITVPPWKGVAVNGVWDNLFNKESRELSEYAKDQWVGKYRVLWRTISYRENPFGHLSTLFLAVKVTCVTQPTSVQVDGG